ncbi:salivary glue protein Sgs-3-like [Penaeus vannamei]|uniref:salivary glue protein Sgs-3-like n=1 Tax=Penaeus vannamei TaxID=6689 RepID=UPI00387FA3D1
MKQLSSPLSVEVHRKKGFPVKITRVLLPLCYHNRGDKTSAVNASESKSEATTRHATPTSTPPRHASLHQAKLHHTTLSLHQATQHHATLVYTKPSYTKQRNTKPSYTKQRNTKPSYTKQRNTKQHTTTPRLSTPPSQATPHHATTTPPRDPPRPPRARSLRPGLTTSALSATQQHPRRPPTEMPFAVSFGRLLGLEQHPPR